MKESVNTWGPAIMVCLTVLVGILMNNKRVDDLRSDVAAQIASLRSDLIARIDGLEKRLVDRLDRLEHPIFKG
jgi:hypothetical protein